MLYLHSPRAQPLFRLSLEKALDANFRNFDLNLLLMLDGVLREGTLSNAAKAMNMSRPTISSSLAKCLTEKELSYFSKL